jgi:aromatic ring-cleaving dioxygenase
MLNSEISSQEHLFPLGFSREFDAHVYYSAESRNQAIQLRAQAIAHFHDRPIFVGALVDELVGPHPLPMFEINFAASFLGEVVLWLIRNRSERSVLVHEVTGDDWKDHSSGAVWFGEVLKLDESRF